VQQFLTLKFHRRQPVDKDIFGEQIEASVSDEPAADKRSNWLLLKFVRARPGKQLSRARLRDLEPNEIDPMKCVQCGWAPLAVDGFDACIVRDAADGFMQVTENFGEKAS
jgi:hypothetical protein